MVNRIIRHKCDKHTRKVSLYADDFDRYMHVFILKARVFSRLRRASCYTCTYAHRVRWPPFRKVYQKTGSRVLLYSRRHGQPLGRTRGKLANDRLERLSRDL